MIRTKKSKLKKLIEEKVSSILEDEMVDNAFTLHKAKEGGEPGAMGIDPRDMKDHLLQQFTVAAGSLVDFLREVRVMREIAAEYSDMEAQEALPGEFGTKMWHALKEIDMKAKELVQDWNGLDEIQ